MPYMHSRLLALLDEKLLNMDEALRRAGYKNVPQVKAKWRKGSIPSAESIGFLLDELQVDPAIFFETKINHSLSSSVVQSAIGRLKS